jgi:hypothetical protein
MFDLDAIFHPEQVPESPRGLRDPDLRVEDLDPDWRVVWEERAAI